MWRVQVPPCLVSPPPQAPPSGDKSVRFRASKISAQLGPSCTRAPCIVCLLQQVSARAEQSDERLHHGWLRPTPPTLALHAPTPPHLYAATAVVVSLAVAATVAAHTVVRSQALSICTVGAVLLPTSERDPPSSQALVPFCSSALMLALPLLPALSHLLFPGCFSLLSLLVPQQSSSVPFLFILTFALSHPSPRLPLSLAWGIAIDLFSLLSTFARPLTAPRQLIQERPSPPWILPTLLVASSPWLAPAALLDPLLALAV